MNTSPTLPISALTVSWHPNTDEDLDILRYELDACREEIERLNAALKEAGRTYERAVVGVGCECSERGSCYSEVGHCDCLLCKAIDAIQAVRG